jgi:hypothetical protein
MKKIYTLLLLFTITLFYSIPTKAYSLDGNDIPLVQTKNLADKTLFLDNNFIGGTGAISFSSTSGVSHLIPINPSTQYIFSANTANLERFALYDINGNNINVAAFGLATTKLFTSTSTTYFVRLQYNLNVDKNFIQLELGGTATSYAPYGFLTLNDIFLDNNLIINGDFSNGLNNWNVQFGTQTFITVVNEALTFNGVFTSTSLRGQDVSITTGDSIYVSWNSSLTTPHMLLRIGDFNNFTNVSNHGIILGYNSLKINSKTNGIRLYLEIFNLPRAININFDNFYVVNLKTLGIDTLPKETLDHYYRIWESNNAYIEGYDDGYTDGYNDGYTDGFNDGYDEGFDDGVASDTSYAVGYALGLSEGEDMETGSSLLILIVALIGFVMMIFGFTTKRGIFNLLSVAAFVVLGGLLIEFVGFIIITFGLVLINIYYAFFGEL